MPVQRSKRTNSLREAFVPSVPKQIAQRPSVNEMLLLSSNKTAGNGRSRDQVAGARSCICWLTSRCKISRSRSLPCWVKRWLKPLLLMNTSRRAATCVNPSRLISGSCHHPKISVCTKSAPLSFRSRCCQPVSRARRLASHYKTWLRRGASCDTLFIALLLVTHTFRYHDYVTQSFFSPVLLNFMPMGGVGYTVG